MSADCYGMFTLWGGKGGGFMAYFSRPGAYREVRLFDECVVVVVGGGVSDSLVPSIVKYK